MNDQLQVIKRLLKDVGSKIEKSKEIAQLKGENFNVFSILGVETKENKTHSNFLVSLLNPKGEHGLGDVFLKLFYDTILPVRASESGVKQEIVNNLRNESVDVKTEDTGGIDGGRVDISIRGKKGTGIIFIENKINAGDQKYQMAKYIKDNKEKKKIVFYLTLDRHQPTKGSTKSKDGFEDAKINVNFFLLSYDTDIKNWLEKCMKEASDYPIIRETIKQYIILIKKLTGQLTSNEMKDKIIESILLNSTNYEAAQSIINLRDEIVYESFTSLIEKLNSLFKTHNLLINRDRSKRVDGFFIPLINYGKYEIGINVELGNNYFFYCAVEKGKVRIPTINKRKEFDNISNYLINSLSNSSDIATRYGYALAGRFNLRYKFSNDFKFSNNTDKFCTSIVTQIVENIKTSKIRENDLVDG